MEIMQSQQPLQGNRVEPVQLPYGDCAEMVWCLCNLRVVVGKYQKCTTSIVLVLSVEII